MARRYRCLLVFVAGLVILTWALLPSFDGKTAKTVAAEPEQTNSAAISVYWAGELFTVSQVSGNAYMAEALWRCSKQRYEVKLPQSLTVDGDISARNIRNTDIIAVASADAIVVNFEGAELDSGTVVEFMIAKHLGMPVVILRTDSRRDGQGFDEPFNLMAKNWPRTEIVSVNTIVRYKALFDEEIAKLGGKQSDMSTRQQAEQSAASRLRDEIALEVSAALNKVIAERSLYSEQEIRLLYFSLPRFAGGALSFEPETLEQVLKRKKAKQTL